MLHISTLQIFTPCDINLIINDCRIEEFSIEWIVSILINTERDKKDCAHSRRVRWISRRGNGRLGR